VGSREDILRALREAAPPPAPLPDLSGRRGQLFPDLAAQFALSLQEVGGRCVQTTEAALPEELRKLARSLDAKIVGSIVPQLPGIDLSAHSIPHTLAGVDLAVLPGELAVAENGAVWITEAGLRNLRALFVLAQHLALVVPAHALVNDIHEAYEKVRIPQPGYGCFVSGPSKTADIEQALVIGAHGARSCTVFLVE
jgi:L-lactate dehydrogenase complex protein LldG